MLKSILSLIAAGSFVVSAATPASIGFVRSTGDFRVDGSTVRGNSTVFDGNVIETASARLIVQLAGAQITLAPESRAKVYQDRTVLEKGAGLFRDAGKHILEAESLKISAAAKDSIVQVDIQGPTRIAVAARTGTAQVRNASGLLIAELVPGTALSFDTQTGASNVVKLTGTVTTRDGKYFLTDATTKVTVELQGADLAKYVGKKVQIEGSTIPSAKAAAGASEVVQVASAQPVTGNGKKAAGAAGTAGAAGAAGAAGGGAAVAVSAATVAVIGGVAVAGTVGGLAAAGTFSGESNTSAK